MNFKKQFYHLNYEMFGKCLTSKTTFFQKSKLDEIYSPDIYVGGKLEFIIFVFSWSISLDDETFTKYKKQ